MSEHEVETLPAEAPAPGGMLAILPDLLRQALAAGPEGVGALERLVALHATLRADMAREAFYRELAAFQAECPSIPKNRVAEITKNGTRQYSYRFADLEQIVSTIRPLLSKHGFSFSFDRTQTDGQMTQVCKLRHLLGHVETGSFQCPIASPNPEMSAQHKVGGTDTYSKRYALVGVLGLATVEDDTDGAGDGEGQEVATIDTAQIDELETRLLELNARQTFLRFFKIEGVSFLPVSRLQEARALLDRTAAARAGVKS